MIDKRQNWDKNLTWEQQKHETFFQDYYFKNNFEILRNYIGNSNPYDIEIKKDKKIFKIDEKAHKPRQRELGCIIELVQDFISKDWGWFLKYDDIIDFHAYWEHEKDFYPKWAYMVNRSSARNWILEKNHIRYLLENETELRINEQGWGITLIMEIPWKLIINNSFVSKKI